MHNGVRTNIPKQLDDPAWVNKFVSYIEDGCHISTAAKACGVAPMTVHSWLHAGQDPDNPCHEFFVAVSEADAELERKLVRRWLDICGKTSDFRALQNFLDRRYRENWGESKEININGQIQHQLQRPDLSKLSPVELQTYLDNAETNRKLLETNTIDVVAEKIT